VKSLALPNQSSVRFCSGLKILNNLTRRFLICSMEASDGLSANEMNRGLNPHN